MANWRSHMFDEIEAPQKHIEELIRSLVHTVLFTRAPGPVKPKEIFTADVIYNAHAYLLHVWGHNNRLCGQTECEYFNLTYARCGVNEVDKHVEDAIKQFLSSLTPAAPELLKGKLVVSFFERRVKKGFFGLMANEEKVIWEQWHFPLLVNTTPLEATSDLERSRRVQASEVGLQHAMMKILSLVQELEHVPTVMYEFEVTSPVGMLEHREDVYSRVMQSPVPFRDAYS